VNEFAIAIALELSDYRSGEIPKIDADHVLRWSSQFAVEDRLPLLSELRHVLDKSYISKDAAEKFLFSLVRSEKLSDGSLENFWITANLLDIQIQGHSQGDMLSLLRQSIKAAYGKKNIGGSNVYIYIDDAIFTGNRVKHDLEKWIKFSAPHNAIVHIITLITHSFAEWKFTENLTEKAKESGKTISFSMWRAKVLENRRYYRNNSDVLWPTNLPENVQAYIAGKPFEPRQAGGIGSIFSSDAARSRLELILLNAGMRIRSFSANPNAALKPLGFGPFGVGFGATVATYRNCPNNAPLALWWGDPNAEIGHPFRKWTPLLPRKTYG